MVSCHLSSVQSKEAARTTTTDAATTAIVKAAKRRVFTFHPLYPKNFPLNNVPVSYHVACRNAIAIFTYYFYILGYMLTKTG